jgi:hypothetical protein
MFGRCVRPLSRIAVVCLGRRSWKPSSGTQGPMLLNTRPRCTQSCRRRHSKEQRRIPRSSSSIRTVSGTSQLEVCWDTHLVLLLEHQGGYTPRPPALSVLFPAPPIALWERCGLRQENVRRHPAAPVPGNAHGRPGKKVQRGVGASLAPRRNFKLSTLSSVVL